MRTTYTDEERAAWRAQMGELAGKVRAMPEAERAALAARLGTVTCEGHPLSPFNCCFLASQAGGRELTMVGGVRQWRKVGRAVAKGERACGRIWVPLGGGGGRGNGNGNGAEAPDGERDEVRFRLVPVFDVTQTVEVAT